MIRRIATSIGKNVVGSIMVLDLGLVEKCLSETPFSGFRKVITKIENMEDNVVRTEKTVSPKRPSSSRGPPS